ncbi:MAG: tyrosine-type recombinase/integrase [Clostridiaceae bacterium]
MAVIYNCEKNGIKYFRLTAVINGTRKEFYGDGKKDAERKRDEAKAEANKGLNLDFKKTAFGIVFRSWLFDVEKNKVSYSTFEKYEGIYRNYIVDTPLANMKFGIIKTMYIQKYYNELGEEGKSPGVIENLNRLLRTFFNYAISHDLMLKNPCLRSKITIPNARKEEIPDDNPDKDVVVFTDEELVLLKKALAGHKLEPLIMLNLGTGLRQGELLALEWSDIDLDKLELIVTKTVKRVKVMDANGNGSRRTIKKTPKSKKSVRKVPIPSKLIGLLLEHKNRQDKLKVVAGSSYQDKNIVFANDLGGYIVVKNLFNMYSRLLKKAGIEHKKFHSLRHTYATKLFERGIPLKTVSVLLGHSNIAITAETYTHVMPKKKIEAAEELNDLFD